MKMESELLVLYLISLLTILPVCILTFDNSYITNKQLTNQLYNEPDDHFSNLSTNEEVETVTRPSMDPRGSWFQFVRHSDRVSNKRNTRNKRKKKRQKTLVGIRKQTGAPGPPGPPGPIGPPGAVITRDEMMEEFKAMVKDAAEKRANELLKERCEACTSIVNGSYTLQPELEEMLFIPRVAAAFHVRLRSNIAVRRRTFMEVKNFQQPFGDGSFMRGSVFDSKEGRFVAPRNALYQFTTRLHIQIKRRSRNSKKLRRRDSIKVLICIDSLCQKNTSLEFISGLESNSKIFTISLNGFLHLKKGQYTSVYVDNSSGVMIKLQLGSDFSGILYGV